jgi:hypothetical protein
MNLTWQDYTVYLIVVWSGYGLFSALFGDMVSGLFKSKNKNINLEENCYTGACAKCQWKE